MDNRNSVTFGEDEDMELPPGFRFHPTDEELITHYLTPKVLDNSFSSRAIGEVDLNKCEPWDLPWRAKIGEKEWYFFCVRDRKYPTGLRTNRATDAGYWKATGKDKEVYKGESLVGMKKTLVFYKGRAPKGEKSNWVSHEYRLEGKFSTYNLTKPAKNEWVISRVFQKTEGGKKVQLIGNEPIRPPTSSSSTLLPPLMGSSHVSCFSINPMEEDIKSQKDMVKEDDTFKYNSVNFPNTNVSHSSPLFPKTNFNSSSSSHQFPPFLGNFQFQDSYLVPSWVTNQKLAQSSFQDMEDSSDSLWSYCT